MIAIICGQRRLIPRSGRYFKITGFTKEAIIGKNVKEVIPDIEKIWIEIYGKVAMEGISVNFEMESAALGKKFKVNAYSPCKGQFATIFDEISEY